MRQITRRVVEWALGFAAIAILVTGLVGQAFEMRRIRLTAYGDGHAAANVFADRRNFKWYALIGAGMASWYVAEHI